MTPDHELLRQYAEDGSEAAFAEVVRRHVDFVHSAARRVTAQDSHLAEDVTQRVFTDLARKARVLSRHQSLAGWLHQCTRYAALAAIRAEQRRRVREHEATAMQAIATPPPDAWAQLRPWLDEAVDELKPVDREAVLLRFFHGKSHREVGEALGLNENSANKRIERALEKLRAHFSRRGVTTTSAILATAIGANAVQAAPADLAGHVTEAALASTTAGTVVSALLLTLLYMSTKTKIALSVALLAALAAIISLNWPTVTSTPTSAAPVGVAAPAPKSAPALPAPAMPPAQVEAPKIATAVETATVSVATSTLPPAAPAVSAVKMTPAQLSAAFTKLVQGFKEIYLSLIGSKNPDVALKKIEDMEPQAQAFAIAVKGTPLEQPVATAMEALQSTKEALQRGDLAMAQSYLEKANQAGLMLEGAVQRQLAGAAPAEVAPAVTPDPAELAALFVQTRQSFNDVAIAVQNNDTALALRKIAALEPPLQTYTQKVENTPQHDEMVMVQQVVQSLKASLQKGNIDQAKQVLAALDNAEQLKNRADPVP